MEGRPRAGLTLVEIVVGLVILAILAAVLYPAVAVQLRRGQAAALADQFNNLRQAIANYQQNVQRHPSLLTQLVTQPGAGATDLCGTLLPAANRAMWRGPYLTQILSGDMPVADAMVQNVLVRDPPNTAGGQPGLLQIVAMSVDSTTAVDLEARFDANNDFTSGTILWQAMAPGIGMLIFQYPIRGC